MGDLRHLSRICALLSALCSFWWEDEGAIWVLALFGVIFEGDVCGRISWRLRFCGVVRGKSLFLMRISMHGIKR